MFVRPTQASTFTFTSFQYFLPGILLAQSFHNSDGIQLLFCLCCTRPSKRANFDLRLAYPDYLCRLTMPGKNITDLPNEILTLILRVLLADAVVVVPYNPRSEPERGSLLQSSTSILTVNKTFYEIGRPIFFTLGVIDLTVTGYGAYSCMTASLRDNFQNILIDLRLAKSLVIHLDELSTCLPNLKRLHVHAGLDSSGFRVPGNQIKHRNNFSWLTGGSQHNQQQSQQFEPIELVLHCQRCQVRGDGQVEG